MWTSTSAQATVRRAVSDTVTRSSALLGPNDLAEANAAHICATMGA